jgi:hypothetical protein
MESERDLAEYRERLIESIQAGPRRSACGTDDSIQVFVNQRRVGSLDGGGGEASLQVQTGARVESVQVRSEDGVLLGGLSAPEYGFRTDRIPFRKSTIELRVQNYAEGGSVNAVFVPAPSLWHRARRALTGVADAAVPRPSGMFVPGMRAVAFTQVLLAVALVGLAADRVVGWKLSERTPPSITPTEAPWAAPVAEVAKLERQVVELSKMQMKALETIEAQQHGMAQLQNTIAKLASTQEAVASGVLTVKQGIEQQRKGAGRDVDRITRLILSKAQTEQAELEAEIHSLTVANDRLSKELSQLEQFNGDLKKRLKSAGVDVSKISAGEPDKPIVARQQNDAPPPSAPPQVAEAPSTAKQQPFLFWVTFSEGTSQESIDQWVRDMRGQKGALTDGWQAVEIQPPTEPMERFLDQIKQAKIVKAVKVSR